MFKVIRTHNTNTLIRVSKSGRESECCKVIDTTKGRLLIINKYKVNSYIFKNKHNIKLKLAGQNYLASFNDGLRVYIKPHYLQYHFEVMRQNSRRYFLQGKRKDDTPQSLAEHAKRCDDLLVDHEGILENMLEYVDTI